MTNQHEQAGRHARLLRSLDRRGRRGRAGVLAVRATSDGVSEVPTLVTSYLPHQRFAYRDPEGQFKAEVRYELEPRHSGMHVQLEMNVELPWLLERLGFLMRRVLDRLRDALRSSSLRAPSISELLRHEIAERIVEVDWRTIPRRLARALRRGLRARCGVGWNGRGE